ncbi:MAG TPA: hypothetical protein VFT38_09890 [Vicinamibacteria bacterium]|nr:hypothetical protein [Vicinamibacteria bacterium]
MQPVPGTTPRRPQAHRVAREVWGSGFGVELDLSRQVLWLSLPPQRAGENDDEPLAPCDDRTVSGFTSASALFVKARLFDEGLCAAVELAAQQGAGTFTGKANLLATLIGEAPQIAAAASLGGLPVAVDSDARRVREAFLARSLAKPIGIYTWSDALRRLFHQDRLLQDELAVPTARALAARLSADPPAAAAYGAYLDLVARLTNKLDAEKPDLRAPDGRYFLPPSRAHGTDLVSRLFAHRPPPDGFSLVDEMVRRIRAGLLALHPSGRSGWYEWQTWALEPLLAPDKTPEAARLRMNDGYRRQFEEMFKPATTVAREANVRPLGLVTPTMPALSVRPSLSVEPMLTYYQRRAAGYDFVRGVLESSFGCEGLRSMRRITASGASDATLGDELMQAASLFRGAAAVAAEEIGMARAEESTARQFRSWAKAPDPELATDIRAMVPVFHDRARNKTKVWAVLGWSTRNLEVEFATPPAALVLEGNVRLDFVPETRPITYPVLAEAYVSRLMDGDEFRAHCDQYRTRAEILRHL